MGVPLVWVTNIRFEVDSLIKVVSGDLPAKPQIVVVHDRRLETVRVLNKLWGTRNPRLGFRV